MKNNYHLKYFLIIILCLYLLSPIFNPEQGRAIHMNSSYGGKMNQKLNNSYYSNISNQSLNILNTSLHLTTNHKDIAQAGNTLFGYLRFDRDETSGNTTAIHRDLVIVDQEGIIITIKSDVRGDIEFINSTTIMYSEGSNVIFWNLQSNITEIIPSITSHHDLEYNPFTDTFLMLGREFYGVWDGISGLSLPSKVFNESDMMYPILYDSLYEIDRQGNVVWYWNGSQHLPFNPNFFNYVIERGQVDWTHSNSIFWDIEENVIFLNARHVDTFYKINHTTGEIIWGLGKMGNFTMYDMAGQERDALFYHAHAVEKIAHNRFLLFDNDADNNTNIDHMQQPGTSRYIEIEINESTMEAREIWSWSGSRADYFSRLFGDADRLPNGNTLGVFGWGTDPELGINHSVKITEVTNTGEIAWELELEHDISYRWGIYRVERFLDMPLIQLYNTTDEMTIIIDEPLNLDIRTWNTIRTRYHSDASVLILNGRQLIHNQSFQFLPHWQETQLKIPLSNLEEGIHNIHIIITNSDGITSSKDLIIRVVPPVFSISGFQTITILTLFFIQKNKRKRKRNVKRPLS